MNEPELYAEPVKAYKLARLCLVGGVVKLSPLNHRGGEVATYENPGTATCAEGHQHRAPVLSCSCGFYAVGEREDLWRLGWHTLETATLEVSLYGKIVEHKHGWRGENQQVNHVEISGRCWWCGEKARFLGARRRKQRYLAPSCENCAKHGRISIEEAAASIGCAIVLNGDLDEKISTRVERLVLLVQTIPAVAIAAVAIVWSLISGIGEIAGVGGLVAGGWLIPGRALAERIVEKVGAGTREKHRVIGRSGGAALFTAIGSWAVSGIVGVIHASNHAIMLAIYPPPLANLLRLGGTYLFGM